MTNNGRLSSLSVFTLPRERNRRYTNDSIENPRSYYANERGGAREEGEGEGEEQRNTTERMRENETERESSSSDKESCGKTRKRERER